MVSPMFPVAISYFPKAPASKRHKNTHAWLSPGLSKDALATDLFEAREVAMKVVAPLRSMPLSTIQDLT